MKFTNNILIGLVICICALLVPYFVTFNGFSFSNDSKDWANFGTYIGGTLGPIGAFLAFWGLIQQNQMYKNNAEIEKISLKLIALNAEIEKLTTRCIGKYQGDAPEITWYGSDAKFDLSILLTCYSSHAADLISSKAIQDNKQALSHSSQLYQNYRAQLSIISKIELMNRFICSLSLLGNNSEALHYNNKYQYLLAELYKKDWIKFNAFSS